MTDYKDIIINNINKLYENIINNEINILKCYSQAERNYYGTIPHINLQPNIINIIADIKSCKKHIILQALLKVKRENKILNNIINVKFNKALIPNKYIYNNMQQQYNKYELKTDYNNITDSINIKIIDKYIENVFFISDEKNSNDILIDKNQLILSTIIITSIEKIYYWKHELSHNNDYNDIKILIITCNNQINNKININYYDIIIIRNDLFQILKQTINTPYNEIIFNRIILDDINIKKTYFIKTFEYYNCLNIILINRPYNNIDKLYSIYNLENNDYCKYHMIDYFNKLLYLNRYLKTKHNNNIFIKNVELNGFINNDVYNNIHLNILYPIYEHNKNIKYNIDNIKSIIEYYINDTITLKFIFTLLNNIKYKNNDNIINLLYKVLINQKKKYITLQTELISKKNQIIQNDNKNTIKLKDNILQNENNLSYCIMTYYEYIIYILDNIIEYECNNDEIIYNNNINLLYIINKILLNLDIYNNKICDYIENYKSKLNINIENNICWICNNKIKPYKYIKYIKNEHKYICKECSCDSCQIINIDNELLSINNNKFLINTHINQTFQYPITEQNYAVINEIPLNHDNIMLNLINYIIKNNNHYKTLIYYGNDDIYKILIKNNIYYDILSGIYENYNNILKNLSDEKKNIILLQPESTLKLSINYDYINNIIFYKCVSNLHLHNYKFNEINRFINKLKQTTKNIYYIL
tara:strand:+ start:11994 stop:14105 length:2112 start_codon:yes stop_codon:yes gene_type:complete